MSLCTHTGRVYAISPPHPQRREVCIRRKTAELVTCYPWSSLRAMRLRQRLGGVFCSIFFLQSHLVHPAFPPLLPCVAHHHECLCRRRKNLGLRRLWPRDGQKAHFPQSLEREWSSALVLVVGGSVLINRAESPQRSALARKGSATRNPDEILQHALHHAR